MSDILDAIRSAVKSMIKPNLLIGKVESFDSSNWTINLTLNIGSKVEDVTIKSVLNGEASGIFIEPVIGSYVLCGMVDGKLENLTAMVYAEIKSIKFAPTEKLILRSEDFGGIVKSESVASEDNALKQDVNSLKQLITGWTPAPGDGGTALKAVLATWCAQSLQEKQKANYENENVTHG